MEAKFTVASCTPENNNFRIEGEDEGGRPITVVLRESVREGDVVIVNAEEGSAEGETVPA